MVTRLYYTIPYHTTLYHTILYYTIIYHTILYHTYTIYRIYLRNSPAKLSQNVCVFLFLNRSVAICATQQQHQGWVNDSLIERGCTSHLSQERWSYCCAVTFSPVAHCILQLLPLTCGATMDDCSWMQRQNLALVHFFFWNSACLCHVRGGKMRGKKASDSQGGVDWHLHVCKGNYHQTRLQCENDLIRRPFQLS